MYQTTMSSNKRPTDPPLADDTLVLYRLKYFFETYGWRNCAHSQINGGEPP